MAITVSKLYNNSRALYQMTLLAGSSGLDNLVEWVHIVEDHEVTGFLHGHELIFTAGYMCRDAAWLLDFTKNLYDKKASALIVNIGPYIKLVPREVMDFCNEVQMPLFTIPWKTRMVDMTRDFCARIVHYQNLEESISTTVKNIIFKVGEPETQIQHMERHGFTRENHFCLINVSVHNIRQEHESVYMEKLKLDLERVARTRQSLFLSFTYQGHLIVVLSGMEMEQIRTFVEELFQLVERERAGFQIHVGVSSLMQDFMNQDVNFEKAAAANRMAVKKNRPAVFYDELDVYKILLAVRDKKVLYEFYYHILGKLEQYDAENGTDLVGFLQVYLDLNGSPQLVAEQQFIHRNTVNNQIKKIEKITGINLLELDERVKCRLCFWIRDIL